MTRNTHPTRERLLDLFDIDVEAGSIVWKRSQGRAGAGEIAGSRCSTGYRRIFVDSTEYKTHSVIYFVAHGEWPSLVDHINGVRDDNRIANLRAADRGANARNRHKYKESKLPGAHRYGANGFAAIVTTDGVQFRIGVYDTEAEAHTAYQKARERIVAAERAARFASLEEMQAERMAA